MGKKNRSKKGFNSNEKSNRSRKDLLSMAGSLVQMCIQNHSRQEEWDFFVSLHAAVELFRKKQKQGLTPYKAVDRSVAMKNFLEWLEKNGAKYSNIELKEISEEQGFGFVAVKDIEENELLTQVPEKVMIKFADAQKSYLGPLIANNDILQMMPNVSLALFLHCERFNSNSFFKPYLDTLPAEFNTTLYFTPNELKHLKGSPTLGTAIHQYKAIVRQFGIIYQMLNSKSSEFVKLLPQEAVDHFDFDGYRWGVSVVTTRQNRIPTGEVTKAGCDKSMCERGSMCERAAMCEEERNLALVPLWDMFNHNIGQITTVFEPESKTIRCVAMQEFKQGEQVTICYGCRPNFELLVHNGFVLINNPYDKIRIPLGISPRDPLYEKRAKLLKRFNIETSSYFTMSSMDNHLVASPIVAFLRIFHMSEDELDVWMQTSSHEIGILQKVIVADDIRFQSDETMWSFFENRLNLLIRGIERVIETSCMDQTLTARSKLALAVRMEEMKILKSCVSFSRKTQYLLKEGLFSNLHELTIQQQQMPSSCENKLPKIDEEEDETKADKVVEDHSNGDAKTEQVAIENSSPDKHEAPQAEAVDNIQEMNEKGDLQSQGDNCQVQNGDHVNDEVEKKLEDE